MLDEVQELWLGPLDVVENDDEWPFARGFFKELAERPSDLVGRGRELLLSRAGC